MPPDLLTPEDVAERIGMSPSWVRKRAQARELPHYKVGGKLRFRWSEIVRFLERHHIEPAPRGAGR